MTTTLTDDEFQRLNKQLLELKVANYNLDSALLKSSEECKILRNENQKLRAIGQQQQQQLQHKPIQSFIESLSVHESDFIQTSQMLKHEIMMLQSQLSESIEKNQSLIESNQILSSTNESLQSKICELSMKKEIVKHDQLIQTDPIAEDVECSPDLIKARAEIDILRMQINDSINEHKISEKRGLKLIKELKKQLNTERNRVDKLQNLLRTGGQYQSDEKLNIESLNQDDNSSGSWCHMGIGGSRTGSDSATNKSFPSDLNDLELIN